jgi:hypothetical protein
VSFCTEFAQNQPRLCDKRVKFPVTVEYYDQRAKIYKPAKGFPFYRVSFRTAGKRRMLTFGRYRKAKKAAGKKVRELHNGQQSAGLTVKESQDAISIREMLAAYRQEGGTRISAHEAVASYLEAAKQLPKGSTLLESLEFCNQRK